MDRYTIFIDGKGQQHKNLTECLSRLVYKFNAVLTKIAPHRFGTWGTEHKIHEEDYKFRKS